MRKILLLILLMGIAFNIHSQYPFFYQTPTYYQPRVQDLNISGRFYFSGSNKYTAKVYFKYTNSSGYN